MSRVDNPVAEAVRLFLESFSGSTRLLVAVSGGSDSTGLLAALSAGLASGRHPHISLHACTVDHGLRPDSRKEAEAVGIWCARHGIPHRIERWEGAKPSTGLQAAARVARYRLLAEAAAAVEADAILTAHTLDDQRETIAMRAERAPEGIGLSGMAGAVLLNGRIWLLRPFLKVTRADIRQFLLARNERWFDDPSNLNRHFERVRVRSQDLPLTPGAEADERHALSERAAEFLTAHVRPVVPFLCLVRDEGIEAALADPGAWRGLLMLVATLGGRVHALEAASCDRVRAFLASGTLSRLTAGRVVFDRRRDGLYLYRERRGIDTLLLAPGQAGVWDGRFHVENRSARSILVAAGSDIRADDGADVPSGVLRRAGAAVPAPVFEDGSPAAEGAAATAAMIAPYAGFLPRFDLPLANALAALAGRTAFPYPPNE